jgi:UDP-GlcNAc:undecaprenyl-phosphate GlcNAc-1-phosphate transferase
VFKLYLLAFLASLAGAAFLTPASIWLAGKFGVLDQPDPRKVHAFPVPRWGGIALFGGVMLGVLALLWTMPRFAQLLDFRHKLLQGGEVVGLLNLRQQFVGILIGATGMLALGMADDRRPVPALVKLLVQIIAAYAAMVYGVRVSGLALPGFGYVELPLLASQAFTLFWMLGFMNAVNLVDGLDGLAAGIVAIAAGTFMVVCAMQGETRVLLFSKQLKLAAVLSAAVFGACVGFLLYNFHPAKVFMGDGGALFLGFMLGAVSVIGTLKTTAVLAVIIPVLVVGLPVLDVAFALLRRFRRGDGLMQPDKLHFHHRLLALGWTQKEIVLLMYVITLLLSVATIVLTAFKGRV